MQIKTVMRYIRITVIKKSKEARLWWLTPVIQVLRRQRFRGITVQSQLGQIVFETLSGKNPSSGKKGW
jgi:hypothetical protein